MTNQLTPEITTGNCMYYICTSSVDEETGEYVPVLVIRDQPGYSPMAGDPEKGTTGWKWGKDLKIAQGLARKQNERIGITLEQENEILISSFRASNL